MKRILSILNFSLIAVPPFHAYGTGIWDEVLAVVGTIVLIIILIHMFFFDKDDDEPDWTEPDTKDEDDKN